MVDTISKTDVRLTELTSNISVLGKASMKKNVFFQALPE